MCAQSCLALCSAMAYSLSGSSVHAVLQARMLEWVSMSSSRGSFWPRDQTCVSSDSCIGWQILYHWATWEAQYNYYMPLLKSPSKQWFLTFFFPLSVHEYLSINKHRCTTFLVSASYFIVDHNLSNHPWHLKCSLWK